MVTAWGVIPSHDASAVLERVTKSAVMKMLVTPSIAMRSAASGSSTAPPATYVLGPPTGAPTVNLRALGLGVLSTEIGMNASFGCGAHRSLHR